MTWKLTGYLATLVFFVGCATKITDKTPSATAHSHEHMGATYSKAAGSQERVGRFIYGHGFNEFGPVDRSRKPAADVKRYMENDKNIYPDVSAKADYAPAAANDADANEFVTDLKVTVLSDMVVDRWTHGEWGFAAFVEWTDPSGNAQSLLFDTGGEPDTVWYNAGKLGLQEKLCDTKNANVFISHNHQDHTAGLVQLRRKCLELNGSTNALSVAYVGSDTVFYARPGLQMADEKNGIVASALQVIDEDNYLHNPTHYLKQNLADEQKLHPDENRPAPSPIWVENEKYYNYTTGFDQLPAYVQMYTTRDGNYRLNGKTVASGIKMKGRFEIVKGPTMLGRGVWTTGIVPRRSNTNQETPYYIGNEQYPMRTPSGQMFPDDVIEDHSLIFNTKEGLVVIAGCAHAGIANIVRHAQHSIFPGEKKVVAVLGGIHLFRNSTTKLNIIADTLADAGVKYILGSHCTGFEATVFLRERINANRADKTHNSGGSASSLDNVIIGTIGTKFMQRPSNLNDDYYRKLFAGNKQFAFDIGRGAFLNRHPSQF